MSFIDQIDRSVEKAQKRLSAHAVPSSRRPRADRGRSRLAAPVLAIVVEELSGQERPPMAALLERIERRCVAIGEKAPSRATVYKLMESCPTASLPLAGLPAAVRSALYNLTGDVRVPAHQVALYCFNHGDTTAISFAAGLPWLAIRQALHSPQLRPRSRGLLRAVALVRGIAR